MNEDHKPGKDGMLGGGVSYRPADANDMQTFEDAKCELSQFEKLGKDGSIRVGNHHDALCRAPWMRKISLINGDATSKTSVQVKAIRGAMLRQLGGACYLAIALTLSLVSTGCQSAMNTSSSSGASTKAPNVFPLTFKEHNFAVHCYNTIGCRVIYDNHDFSPYADDQDPDTLISPPPRSPQYKEDWGFGSYIGVRNFPRPAEVRWKSKDGIPHETKIDISEIFKDERVLHNVPESDYAEGSFDGSPSIFLEVNDRTINVYMEAYVPTKSEQVPGNKNSTHRYDLILARSHTY